MHKSSEYEYELTWHDYFCVPEPPSIEETLRNTVAKLKESTQLIKEIAATMRKQKQIIAECHRRDYYYL